MTRAAGSDNALCLGRQEKATLERTARFGTNLTNDPNFSTKSLFVS